MKIDVDVDKSADFQETQIEKDGLCRSMANMMEQKINRQNLG